jgi:hypothetical protein
MSETNYETRSQAAIDALFIEAAHKTRYTVTGSTPIHLHWSKPGSGGLDTVIIGAGQLVWLSPAEAAYPHVTGHITEYIPE